MSNASPVSVNARAWALLQDMINNAEELKIGVSTGSLGETLIDAGSAVPGSIAAGLQLARICMGGLGTVTLLPDQTLENWPFSVSVASSNPVTSCLASQYAGWSLHHKDENGSFFALGSGPARALARGEKLFEELTYRDESTHAVLVLEAAKPPPAAIVERVARECRVVPENLGIIYAPTQSLAGSVQVVGRVLEVALHKTHELHFPLENVVDGIASAPLPPPHPDFVTAMGRTNDAIIFAGRVHLFVKGSAEEARKLAEQLPASTSRDYGKPFKDIFAAVKGDFYKIDPSLFSPAEVLVTAIETGETFRAGKRDQALLDASFN
ncbi:N5,N10-methenyltetrahydromethanopterin cyclohydrolase [Granulibacter bethesdensis]|uniref:Methenyltetrahydromethanopterin cyclohydrolase n=1 Tax=Granulibacter bethesdensis TaxID=364410 RepID=A0AAC9K703_9PROT|nr:methenyltetrahydromethanopterin cyclohydrolase [Granulibacter bethesdensis]APH54025.1 N5,N10-methenyltetrahydromethanopterin cyclohydrolase [Granulibacter bethesdensis]APH61607.1 N5,N10-methenyltetrahydromethanopterin cyclohydrolase [Granulibacter bethesdensis]